MFGHKKVWSQGAWQRRPNYQPQEKKNVMSWFDCRMWSSQLRMEAWATWKRQRVASVYRQIGNAPVEHLAKLFSGTVDLNRHSLFFWGFPMASLSPVMVLAPASQGCWFHGSACVKATPHLSGIVLLSSDPSGKLMALLNIFLCTQYVEMHLFVRLLLTGPRGTNSSNSPVKNSVRFVDAYSRPPPPPPLLSSMRQSCDSQLFRISPMTAAVRTVLLCFCI